jgi:hypothetical protein
MSANLGFMTNPTVSGSVPWLTYLNSIVLIGIIIFLVPCNRLPSVATASMLPTKANAFSIIEQETLTSINLVLEFIIAGCIIVGVMIYIWKSCCKDRQTEMFKTLFQLTLYAGEDESSVDLGKSAFKITEATQFTSPTSGLLPSINVTHGY